MAEGKYCFYLLVLFISIGNVLPQLAPVNNNQTSSSTKNLKISTRNLNECYGVGVQRARILFNTKYPVVNKLNLFCRASSSLLVCFGRRFQLKSSFKYFKIIIRRLFLRIKQAKSDVGFHVTDAPKNIADVSGEAKPQARDAGYYGAIVEGMVRCLTAQLQLTTQEVQDLVEMELGGSDNLLSEACLIPEDQKLPMPNDMLSRSLQNTSPLAQSAGRATPLIELVQNMIDPNNFCLLYPFRTASGYCNNPVHPEWGTSFRPFKRFLPPDYDDGIGAPRLRSRSTLKLLPNPRKVSTSVHTSENRPHPTATHMVMQWGQILDHDITHTPTTTDAKGKVPKCCNIIGRNPECFPIIIPEDDFFFVQHGKRCLELVRSMATTRPGCRLGPREQINQVTSFIDASMVHGSTEAEMNLLRSFHDGQLRIAEPKPHGIPSGGSSEEGGVTVDFDAVASNKTSTKVTIANLPDDEFFDDCVNRFTRKNVECMKAGDVRVNEQAGLTAIHTLLLRQHNLIAVNLRLINPHWDDERLFQESRKIVGAIVQVVTYKEWLPAVLGPDVMRGYELSLLNQGYSMSYNISEDPTIANVVGAAAFRFGHSLIQGAFEMRNYFGLLTETYKLTELFNQPHHLLNTNQIDQMIKGMCIQRSQRFDRFMDNQITNHLLEDPPGQDGKGQDLMTRNIQRGRDHGLPPYADWRAACGLEVPRDFQHLRRMNVMGDDAPDIFEQLYDEVFELVKISPLGYLFLSNSSVQDVDLFPAAMSERPLPGAIVGPTVACILGFQFRKVKIGDRFWHENGLAMPSSFTLEKLRELRKMTMARLICDTTDTITRIQPNVFLDGLAVPNNIPRQCSELPAINLEMWREDPNDLATRTAMRFAMEHKPIPPQRRTALDTLVDTDGKNVALAQAQAISVLTPAQTRQTSPTALPGRSDARFFT